MLNIKDFFTMIQGKNYILLLDSPEIQSYFLFLQDELETDVHLVTGSDQKTIIRIVYITEENCPIDRHWFHDMFSRRIKFNNFWILNKVDRYYFNLYYDLVYLRKNNSEHYLLMNTMPEMGIDKAIAVINAFLIKNQYSSQFEYSFTRYLDRQIYKRIAKRENRTFYQYFWRKMVQIAYIKKSKIKQNIKITKQNACPPLITNSYLNKHKVKAIHLLKTDKSSSGCSLYIVTTEDDNMFFVKGNEIRELDSIKREKEASRRIKCLNNIRCFYLIDSAGIDANYLALNYVTWPTLSDICLLQKKNVSFEKCLIDFCLEVIQDLFEAKIIHRDIRADNIFVIQNGEHYQFLLTDFGCAVFDRKVPRVKTDIQRFNYLIAGVDCRAGANVWDDAGSLLMLCCDYIYNFKERYPVSYEALAKLVGRYCLFEFDEHM